MRALKYRRAPRHLVLFVLVMVSAAACGGPQRTVAVVTSPFTEEHAAVFENSMDFVRDPRVLDGQWRESWEDALDQRIEHADVIALVTISTVRTDVDLSRRRTYRLITEVEDVYFGERVGDEIALVVQEGEGGFEIVETNEGRLLDSQHTVFLKWAEDEDGRVRARWHLSPASEQVALRVRSRLRERGDIEDEGTRRVIIRRN